MSAPKLSPAQWRHLEMLDEQGEADRGWCHSYGPPWRRPTLKSLRHKGLVEMRPLSFGVCRLTPAGRQALAERATK